MSRFELSDRVALVTGALGKLGPVWCSALLDAGATVIGVDLATGLSSRAAAELRDRYGERVQLWESDVRDRAQLETVRDRCRRELQAPSILVNNAGIDQPPGVGRRHPIHEIPLDAFREVFEVNVLGAFQATQVFAPAMLDVGRGSIVNIGSLYASVSPDARFYAHIPGDVPFLKPPAYGASKGALLNLTRYLAAHWGPFGVRVNVLSPGGVLGEQDSEFKRKFTERVPLGRMAVADDLCGPLVFLASDASSYVTGVDLRVEGGFTAW
jgi:NAD(P)-dependent dehydrogenase (short-subunit alcohol dehydrogenase family)